ncbi:hypothetical protein L7F22_004529 [Adiantum nelumboides]|nr:hypothetical protein [Adiantum nelumboides]
MAKASLCLTIEQGPKSGSRVLCKPASLSTVGRARANTLQISKDAGISQKHVCVQWRDDDAEHVGWMAMDMGSSNGTIINNRHAEPHEWICLQNGDLIKIGAETTIRVEIEAVSDEDDLQAAPSKRTGRPNRRACAVAAASQSKAIAEEDSCKVSSTLNLGQQPESKSSNSPPADVDLNMTVEQWFQHMMEEGPKYLCKVSEAMIQDILLESKQFDEYVMSLG